MTDLMERDAGFCSGGDEDDMEAEDGIHSPTDASEDSVDVKVQAISLKNKNKRKCAEPRRVDTELPAKKRKILVNDSKCSQEIKNRHNSNSSPFRPWSRSPTPHTISKHSPSHIILPIVAEYYNREPPRLPIQVPVCRPPTPSKHRLPSPARDARFPIPALLHQEEPLSLVSKRKTVEVKQRTEFPVWHTPTVDVRHPSFPPQNDIRVSRGRGASVSSENKVEENEDNNFRIDSLLSSVKNEPALKREPSVSQAENQRRTSQGNQQRNYKNMTRERRIEANARERTRVHTISAAFDTLRRSVPAYSHNQKLSKLSVLRIACSYIMTLSRLAGYDYSAEQSEPDLSVCVDNVSKTIQTEGKLRKKKED